jgi:hypothetical protein
VITDLHLLAEKIQRERGITYTEAVTIVLRERPELGDRHRKEVIAAVERFSSTTSGDVVKQFDSLVEAHREKHGGTYADALMVVAEKHRDLAERRRMALNAGTTR